MSAAQQSNENHAKLVPAYHYAALPLVFVSTLYFLYTAVTDFSIQSAMTVAFAVGVLITAVFARVFALGAQDRVIRLEERLRMERLFPDDLKARIDEIATEHVIGLRFAPDDELEGLTRRVLAGELSDRKAVKAAIQNWRADHQRL